MSEIENYITQLFINNINNNINNNLNNNANNNANNNVNNNVNNNENNNQNNKFIILYIDNNIYNDFDIEINNFLLEKYNIKVIKFLLNTEEKKINFNNLYEIYVDNHTEEYLINNCFFIIYLSKIIRSNNLIDLLYKNKKYIYFFENVILNDEKFKNSLNQFIKNILNFDSELNNNIEENFQNFKIYYENLNKNKDIKLIIPIQKNILINFNKKNNNIIDENYKKITIITYYKKYDFEILNIIQKKCIIENIKNKNVYEICIIGENLEEEFKEIINEYKNINKNIILYQYSNYLTFKDLLTIINDNFKNKIICMLRSDIILPNQNDLDDIKLDLLSTENREIYSLSRIERLVNGNLIKNNNLNKVLSSTEQDGWIFIAPLIINLESLENIYFYNKHSELYFNKLLKDNNYNIINNTNKYKIIRILYDNNLDNRLLLKNDIVNFKDNPDIYLLPENNLIDKISLDNLLKLFNLDNNEIYNIKCDIFNKYFKNIIN